MPIPPVSDVCPGQLKRFLNAFIFSEHEVPYPLMGLRLFLTVTLIFNGFIAGGFLGGKFVSPADGLAGGAVVLWFVIGGALAGLVTGVILAGRLSRTMVLRACIISSLLAVLFSAIVFLRAKHSTENFKKEPQKPTTVPVGIMEEGAQPMRPCMARPRLVIGARRSIYIMRSLLADRPAYYSEAINCGLSDDFPLPWR